MSNEGWTLSQFQEFREQLEIDHALWQVEREHKMRQLLGDDVYDFMRASVDSQAKRRPAERCSAMLNDIHDKLMQLGAID